MANIGVPMLGYRCWGADVGVQKLGIGVGVQILEGRCWGIDNRGTDGVLVLQCIWGADVGVQMLGVPMLGCRYWELMLEC